MEIIKIRLKVNEIQKVKHKEDATLIYTGDKVYICKKDSENIINEEIVEYTLKDLKGKGGMYGQK